MRSARGEGKFFARIPVGEKGWGFGMLKGAGCGRKLPYIKNKLISALAKLFLFQIVNPRDH